MNEASTKKSCKTVEDVKLPSNVYREISITANH